MRNHRFGFIGCGLLAALAASGCGSKSGGKNYESARAPVAYPYGQSAQANYPQRPTYYEPAGARVTYPNTPQPSAYASHPPQAYQQPIPQQAPVRREAVPAPNQINANGHLLVQGPMAGYPTDYRTYPVAVKQLDAYGREQVASIDTSVRYDQYGRPVIVQTMAAPACPGPSPASGAQGEAIWIGCGLPPTGGATLPPVISPEVRQSLGVRMKS